MVEACQPRCAMIFLLGMPAAAPYRREDALEWRRAMAQVFFLLLLGLEIKHFIADYLLQTTMMLRGKGDLRAAGGYAHAGVHAAASAVVLFVAGVPLVPLLGIILAEFCVHYGLDYWKMQYGRNVQASSQPKLFWALHGLDQLFHQLTYAAMIFAAMVALGLV